MLKATLLSCALLALAPAAAGAQGQTSSTSSQQSKDGGGGNGRSNKSMPTRSQSGTGGSGQKAQQYWAIYCCTDGGVFGPLSAWSQAGTACWWRVPTGWTFYGSTC